MDELFGRPSILAIALVLSASYVFAAAYFIMRRREILFQFSTALPRLLPVMIAAFAGIVAVYTNVLLSRSAEQRATEVEHPSWLLAWEDIDRLPRQVSTLEEQLEALRQGFIAARPPDPDRAGAAIAALKSSVDENSAAIARFEGLFVTEAERLVSLPLLKRDIEDVRSDVALVNENIASLRTLLIETNVQNRWTIGTLALGVLALVLPAIRSLFSPSTGNEQRTGTTDAA